MRLVRVKAPAGRGAQVAEVAFGVGISQTGFHQQQSYKADGSKETKDIVDIEVATPTAKAFIDRVMAAPFFDSQEYSITVRQPRSIVTSESPRELTKPIVLPTSDIFEDLWQFSHITTSYVGRMLIGAMLLSYGMIKFNLLLIIAGLFFLPLLPLLLGIAFGLWTREWRLAGQAVLALLVGSSLIVGGAAAVALMTGPPLRFQEFNPMLTSFLISLAVGIGATLANSDDAGRRELIGLAATAQTAIIPAWLGISLVLGFPQLEAASPSERILTFFINVVTIIVAAITTYALLGMRGDALKRFSNSTSS